MAAQVDIRRATFHLVAQEEVQENVTVIQAPD